MRKTMLAFVFSLIVSLFMMNAAAPPMYPEEWPGGHPPGQDPPPEEPPPEGYWTVDSPSADTYDFLNVGDSSRARNRGGGSAALWSEYPLNDSALWTDVGLSEDFYGRLSRLIIGGFDDDNVNGHWSWPAQTMPLGNATILDIWMIVNITTPAGIDMTAWLAWSLNGWSDFHVTNGTTKLNLSNDISVESTDDYTIFGINITSAKSTNWTPQEVMSPSFQIMFYYTYDWILPSEMFYIDYLGIRYNWTLNASAPPEPIYDWDDSPLAGLDSGEIFIGSLGALGFIGLVIFPAVAIWYYRHSDESKIMVAVQLISIMAFCFTLMLWAIS